MTLRAQSGGVNGIGLAVSREREQDAASRASRGSGFSGRERLAELGARLAAACASPRRPPGRGGESPVQSQKSLARIR